MMTIQKQPILLADLGKHTPKEMAEVCALLEAGIIGHPDSDRPHFYKLDGTEQVYYIFRYPSGRRILLIAAWDRVGAGRIAA